MSSRTSNRMKEEERIERIIRNLLKLPENRRCINCNSLGPQYVCTTFWTFVCSNCSGVHREFTHRVKSVSMAKFNAEEVSALEAGGNERARQIYFKEWDPQRHSFPDGSNQNRLRDFIKHVYVDRKFAGDRSMGKLAMARSGANEDSSERPSFERPSPVRRIDDRSSKYYIEERRSPQNKPDNVRSGHRNRPAHFEIVDDRFRDDGYGSGRRYETHRSSNEESRAGSRSPVSQKSRDKTSSPVVRQVRDLLGENVPRLQVGGSPKSNDRRDAESSGPGQKTESPREPGSVDAKSPEHKAVNSVSLIDFSAEPELPNPAAAAQTQQTALAVEGGNVASDPQTVNSLESLLFGLSAPTSGPIDIMSEAPGNSEPQSAAPVALSNANITESTTSKPAAPGTGDVPAASPVGMELMLLSSNDSNVGVADGRQLPITQQSQFYSSPSGDSVSPRQLATPSVGALYNQSWTSSVAPNAQASSCAPAEESSQPSPDAAHDTTLGVGSQPLPVEAKSCGMKELPADIFTSSYSSFPAPVPSWQIRPPHGMGYHMQYHPHAVPVPAFPNSARSRNPFDLNDDSTEAQVPMFPSMLPMQGALPNFPAPSALLHSSDAHSSHLMQPQASAYTSIASPQMPYGMSLSPEAFNEQQLHNRMPFSGSQNTTGATRSNDAFASLNPIHQPSSRYSAPTTTTTNSFSSAGGNPFG